MFILIIWLQGIYLPQHGYSFSQTPLWAGIALLRTPCSCCMVATNRAWPAFAVTAGGHFRERLRATRTVRRQSRGRPASG